MSFWNVLRSIPPGIAHNGKDPRRVINTPAFHLENVPSVPYCPSHMVLIESSWTDLRFSLTYAMNYYTEKHYKECPFIWIPGSWIVFFFPGHAKPVLHLCQKNEWASICLFFKMGAPIMSFTFLMYTCFSVTGDWFWASGHPVLVAFLWYLTMFFSGKTEAICCKCLHWLPFGWKLALKITLEFSLSLLHDFFSSRIIYCTF